MKSTASRSSLAALLATTFLTSSCSQTQLASQHDNELRKSDRFPAQEAQVVEGIAHAMQSWHGTLSKYGLNVGDAMAQEARIMAYSPTMAAMRNELGIVVRQGATAEELMTVYKNKILKGGEQTEARFLETLLKTDSYIPHLANSLQLRGLIRSEAESILSRTSQAASNMARGYEGASSGTIHANIPNFQRPNSPVGGGTHTAPRGSGAPALSPGEALDAYASQLNTNALSKQNSNLVGRDEEVERLMRSLLNDESQKIIVLKGQSKVGKTSVLYKYLQRVNTGKVPSQLKGTVAYTIDIDQIMAGAGIQGEIGKKLGQLEKGIAETAGKRPVLIYMKDLHQYLDYEIASKSEHTRAIMGFLKKMNETPNVRIVGTTNAENFKVFEKNLDGFKIIDVNPLKEEEVLKAVMNRRDYLMQKYDVEISEEIAVLTTKVATQYGGYNRTPLNFALSLLDESTIAVEAELKMASGADEVMMKITQAEGELNALKGRIDDEIAKGNWDNAGKIQNSDIPVVTRKIADLRSQLETVAGRRASVTAADLQKVAIQETKIKGIRINPDEGDDALVELAVNLGSRVTGQNDAVEAVSDAMLRAGKMKDPNRPIATFIFAGTTGTGKTELSKALAEFAFGDEAAMVRIDMGEYSDATSAKKLIGSDPGYVGYGEGTVLTNGVLDRPYTVVLFDEIEKGHVDTYKILMKLLDEGKLTDGMGREIDFRNTIVIMTTNVGAESVGKVGGVELENAIKAGFRERGYPPEFLGRVDEVIGFNPHSRESLMTVAKFRSKSVKQMAASGMKIDLEFDALAYEHIAVEAEKNIDMGARSVRQFYDKVIRTDLARLGTGTKTNPARIKPGDAVKVSFDSERQNFVYRVYRESMSTSSGGKLEKVGEYFSEKFRGVQ